MDTAHIDLVLEEAGLGVDDIDMIALTSGQCYELVSDNSETLSVITEPHPDCRAPSPLQKLCEKEGFHIEDHLIGNVLTRVYGQENSVQYHRNLFPEYQDRDRSTLGVTGYLSGYIDVPHWGEPLGLEDLAKFDHSFLADSEEARMGFHYPFTVCLRGRNIPAYMIQHHAAHAASSYYPSGFRRAAVLTHDGAFYRTGHNNGMIYRGDENRLYPLTPHHLAIGDLYDRVGASLGFDLFGAAGKLMGLAPYGKPRFFDRRFVGNSYDLATHGFEEPIRDWVKQCLKAATDMGYDLSPVGDPERILEPACVDIAASTQKLLEKTILLAVECTGELFRTMKRPMENLCYAGGTALSCPTNSRLFREGPFKNLYIPPDCDDSGLSMGGRYTCITTFSIIPYRRLRREPRLSARTPIWAAPSRARRLRRRWTRSRTGSMWPGPMIGSRRRPRILPKTGSSLGLKAAAKLDPGCWVTGPCWPIPARKPIGKGSTTSRPGKNDALSPRRCWKMKPPGGSRACRPIHRICCTRPRSPHPICRPLPMSTGRRGCRRSQSKSGIFTGCFST